MDVLHHLVSINIGFLYLLLKQFSCSSIFLDGEPRPIPKISVKSKVAYGKDVTLQCSASGSSLELTWYKRKENGTKNDWQLMKSVKQRTSFNIHTGKRESKQTLVIKKFNVSDNGVYICHLRRNYVKWTKYDEMYVGIRGIYLPLALNLHS